jgi:hypothetical protein
MRTAVCISGYMRTYRSCFPSFKKNLLDCLPGQVDVYVHTWDAVDQLFFGGEHALDVAEVVGLYRPMAIMVEPQSRRQDLKISPTMKHTGLTTLGQKFMFYGIWRVNQLKLDYEDQTGERYDTVIRVRSDLNFDEPFPFHAGVPADAVYATSVGKTWMSDTYACGSSALMDVYASVFPWLDTYHEAVEVTPSGVNQSLAAEAILYEHLNAHEVCVKRMKQKNWIRRWAEDHPDGARRMTPISGTGKLAKNGLGFFEACTEIEKEHS